MGGHPGLGEDHDVLLDVMVNHISRQSAEFREVLSVVVPQEPRTCS
ncbi:MAG: hypothetical protein R3C32_01775 [Chloroflexota bacterium]